LLRRARPAVPRHRDALLTHHAGDGLPAAPPADDHADRWRASGARRTRAGHRAVGPVRGVGAGPGRRLHHGGVMTSHPEGLRTMDDAQREQQGQRPAPRPAGIGLRGWLRWAWRQLTSMRVALMLLMLLALGALP